MLSVQSGMNYGPAFGASRRRTERQLTPEELEARKYSENRRELLEQKEELEDLAESKDFKLPEPAKKVIKGGAVVTTGLLGGMATGWGWKKSLGAFSKIAKSAPVLSMKKHIKATKTFIADAFKTVKTKFKKSEAYTMPANAINKQYRKFADTKFGAPIVKFFKSIKKGVKTVFDKISGGVKKVWNKIRGVKKETVEKASTNFVGASGGVAAGVTALKKEDESGED